MSSIEPASALEVLFEDIHVRAVLKPAGLPVQQDRTGDPSLLEMAIAQFGGEPLWLVHRLDRPVSGLVLLARSAKVAAELDSMFREGTVHKRYWAIVEGHFLPWTQEGKNVYGYRVLRHTLKHDARSMKARVVDHKDADIREVVLHTKPLAQGDRYTLVEVIPQGGAFHQIRAQLAASGHPIKGDVKYGARRSEGDRSIALHARSLELQHPVSAQPLRIEAPAPRSTLWDALLRKATAAQE